VNWNLSVLWHYLLGNRKARKKSCSNNNFQKFITFGELGLTWSNSEKNGRLRKRSKVVVIVVLVVAAAAATTTTTIAAAAAVVLIWTTVHQWGLGNNDTLVYTLPRVSLGQDWPQYAADDVRRRVGRVESSVEIRREAGLFVLDTELRVLDGQRPRQTYTLVDVAQQTGTVTKPREIV